MPSQIRPHEDAEPFIDREFRRLADVSFRLGTWQGVVLASVASIIVEVLDFVMHSTVALSTPFALVVVLVAWLSTPTASLFAVVLGTTLCSVQNVVARGVPVNAATVAVDAFRLLTLGALALMAHQLRRALTAMRTLAIRDPLTGLYNRRGFFELAGREVARSQRDGTPFTVVEMDLDGLKQINDAHGHAVGDAALVRFAKHAAGRLRETDVLGRTGGDEFSLVLPVGSDAAASVIRSLVDIPPTEGQPALRVSAGAVSYPRASVSLHLALIAADKEMYSAKAQGIGVSIVVMPD